MMKLHFVLLPALLLALQSHPLCAAEGISTSNRAAVPTIRNDWLERHARLNAIAQAGGVNVLFIGDSITEGWAKAGKDTWDQRYRPLGAANFGIGGDKTEHVLWRLQNGNLAGIQPKVTVLMIGTNNTGRDTAADIAGGIAAIVQEIKMRLPATKILLLGIFPRANQIGSGVIEEINRLVSPLEDGKTVYFLDIGKRFQQPDGTVSKEIMPDGLHLSAEGYKIWGDAIHEKLTTLLTR